MRLSLGALVPLLFLAATPGGAQIPESATELNNAFREAYSDARKRVLEAGGPLLIVNGDTAALVRGGHRSTGSINAPAYHLLKTIAHIPLAIFVTLTPGMDELDAGRLKTLEKLARLIPPARAGIQGLGFSSEVLERQDRIASESLSVIAEATAKRSFSPKDRDAFAARMAPLVLANVNEATRAQLDSMHAQVSAWRRELTAGEWRSLHVLIITSHMAREESVHVQYFAKLLNEPAEGSRIVVAESLWEEPKALELYGTHLLDADIGRSFFRDPLRMHRDLLADAAKEYLAKLLQ